MNLIKTRCFMGLAVVLLWFGICSGSAWAGAPAEALATFPPALDSYQDEAIKGTPARLLHRIQQAPFNLVATLLFLGAVIHTFMAGRFKVLSHARQRAHQEKIRSGAAREGSGDLMAGVYHFLGEVEVVFGLWVVPLMLAILLFYDWATLVHYIDHDVDLTEAAFVGVMMVLAATRPILKLGEQIMTRIAGLLGGSLAAFWMTVLTVGPLLGSLITEPAAMTISALLLSRKFYALGPSTRLKYATLGLLFVNVSVGGTLTHFAAPPVLMAAGPWGWDSGFMLSQFGWKAAVGILIANTAYFWLFRRELTSLQSAYAMRLLKEEIARNFVSRQVVELEWARGSQAIDQAQGFTQVIEARATAVGRVLRERVETAVLRKAAADGVEPTLIKEALDQRFAEITLYQKRRYLPLLLSEAERGEFQDPDWDQREDAVPVWVTCVHLLFMAWTIVNAHHGALFILGLLFFLGFAQVTAQYQNRINLQTPLLVGFFLAGLVIHGGLQAWWIAPVLGSLGETPLMLGATLLSAFNDNAAITYLSTLVPGFTDGLKYAVVAGAVTGGGLTVIANAPNPAGQSLLKQHFDGVVAPQALFWAALAPTVILWLCFALL